MCCLARESWSSLTLRTYDRPFFNGRGPFLASENLFATRNQIQGIGTWGGGAALVADSLLGPFLVRSELSVILISRSGNRRMTVTVFHVIRNTYGIRTLRAAE